MTLKFLTGVVESYEISCYSPPHQNKQAFSPMYASCFTIWCPSEGFGNIWHHFQMYGHKQTEPWAVHLQCW